MSCRCTHSTACGHLQPGVLRTGGGKCFRRPSKTCRVEFKGQETMFSLMRSNAGCCTWVFQRLIPLGVVAESLSLSSSLGLWPSALRTILELKIISWLLEETQSSWDLSLGCWLETPKTKGSAFTCCGAHLGLQRAQPFMGCLTMWPPPPSSVLPQPPALVSGLQREASDSNCYQMMPQCLSSKVTVSFIILMHSCQLKRLTVPTH